VSTPTTPPRRIVCLTEEPTEILWALGEGARVVGISAWTCRPEGAREAAPIVSGFVGGNVDKIQALEPELVIGFSDIQAELASKLIRAGLPVWITNQRSVAEILENALLLGRMVGREQEAVSMIAGWQTHLDALAARSASWPRRPRVYFEEWPDPMISAIRWVSELIHVAGGENVFDACSHGSLAKERFVQPEDVIAAMPDVIFASWCGKPVDKDAIRARPGWDAIPAVQTGQIHEIPSATILQPGPGAVTDGVSELARHLEAAATAPTP
jgi:iron complex transport system substrate-binding protein